MQTCEDKKNNKIKQQSEEIIVQHFKCLIKNNKFSSISTMFTHFSTRFNFSISDRNHSRAFVRNVEAFLIKLSFEYCSAIGASTHSKRRAELGYLLVLFVTFLCFTKNFLTDSNQSPYLCDNTRFVSRAKEKEKY